jgi:hypothetical protein
MVYDTRIKDISDFGFRISDFFWERNPSNCKINPQSKIRIPK